MQWSAVTITLFAGVAILFVAGVGLIWVGLRREPDRLPRGADDVLDAIGSLRLSPPPGSVVVDDTGEVRLVPGDGAPVTAPLPPAVTRQHTGDTGPIKIIQDPRDALAHQDGDDDLTVTERLFFADEPQLNKF